jgi:hypothetical protein
MVPPEVVGVREQKDAASGLIAGTAALFWRGRLGEQDFRSDGPWWSSPRIDFSTLARARAVCAFTVPMGTPKTRAVSQTER